VTVAQVPGEANCNGGAGGAGRNNLCLSGDISGGSACQQYASGPNPLVRAPACPTGAGGEANGVSPSAGGACGDGLGGHCGTGGSATGGNGGFGEDGCFATGSCFNDNKQLKSISRQQHSQNTLTLFYF
jgi:hypothetical protein